MRFLMSLWIATVIIVFVAAVVVVGILWLLTDIARVG